MWVFLSRRIRMWALLTFVFPVGRLLLRRVAQTAARRAPEARTTKLLGQANSAVANVGRRRR